MRVAGMGLQEFTDLYGPCQVTTATGVNSGGYGYYWLGGKQWGEHRLVFYLQNHWLPPVVRHRCHNAWCVAPRHLVAGTASDNRGDTVAADNHAHGETHWKARLTADDVREIRRLRSEEGLTYQQLADRFGVGKSNISHIVKGRLWKKL